MRELVHSGKGLQWCNRERLLIQTILVLAVEYAIMINPIKENDYLVRYTHADDFAHLAFTDFGGAADTGVDDAGKGACLFPSSPASVVHFV